MNDLTTAERVRLCDFVARKYGGYGRAIHCNGAALEAPPSQAGCVTGASVPCNVTVSDVEACTKETSCSNQAPAACIPLHSCGSGVE